MNGLLDRGLGTYHVDGRLGGRVDAVTAPRAPTLPRPKPRRASAGERSPTKSRARCTAVPTRRQAALLRGAGLPVQFMISPWFTSRTRRTTARRALPKCEATRGGSRDASAPETTPRRKSSSRAAPSSRNQPCEDAPCPHLVIRKISLRPTHLHTWNRRIIVEKLVLGCFLSDDEQTTN